MRFAIVRNCTLMNKFKILFTIDLFTLNYYLHKTWHLYLIYWNITTLLTVFFYFSLGWESVFWCGYLLYVLFVLQMGIGECFSKEVNLVFFTAGAYKLELRCCPTVVISSVTPAPSSLTTATPSITHAANTSSVISSHFTSQQQRHHHSSHHHHNSSSHHGGYHHSSTPTAEVWMFAPAIELTISH